MKLTNKINTGLLICLAILFFTAYTAGSEERRCPSDEDCQEERNPETLPEILGIKPGLQTTCFLYCPIPGNPENPGFEPMLLKPKEITCYLQCPERKLMQTETRKKHLK